MRYLLQIIWPSSDRGKLIFSAVVVLVLLIAARSGGLSGVFPQSLQYPVHEPVDAFADWVPANLKFILNPISKSIKANLKALDRFMLSLPWPLVVLAFFLLGQWLSGLRLAALCGASLMFMGLIGLWKESIITLNIMTVAVLVTILLGLPLGVVASRSARFEGALRPILDAMQTMPIFVYLIPVMLLFGLGSTSAVVATIIYALPPVIRLTNLGIRQVSNEALEAAAAYGSTSWQTLRKVQLPLARPTIMLGINQTVMMALSMVIFVALIGASGLGKEIWISMRRLRIGDALEGGMAVVLLAIMLDRISYALSQRQPGDSQHRRAAPYDAPGTIGGLRRGFDWVCSFLRNLSEALATALGTLLGAPLRLLGQPDLGRSIVDVVRAHWFFVGSVSAFAVLLVVHGALFDMSKFPREWQFSIARPIDSMAEWMNINLAFITDFIRTNVYVYGLGPARTFLAWAPWPVLILAIGLVAWRMAGFRIAVLAWAGFGLIGIVGMWEATMLTLSQVGVALTLTLVIALPLGVIASRSDRLDVALRPLLDAMQTLPAFVYFPVIVILFRIGDLSGIIATVIYAMPPAVRMTNLGIRQVPREATEAARAFGSTRLQILAKVQIPMALPSIMMGVNQTTMMALAMVIYAALLGATGLGFEVLLAIGEFDVGRGFEAGLSIVIVAVTADRITQAWARRRSQALGLSIS